MNQPTKEQILKAAECSSVKEALTQLFPEVMEEIDKYVMLCKPDGKLFKPAETLCVDKNNVDMVQIGATAAPRGLQGKCLYLNSAYIWRIADSEYSSGKLLIPTKK